MDGLSSSGFSSSTGGSTGTSSSSGFYSTGGSTGISSEGVSSSTISVVEKIQEIESNSTTTNNEQNLNKRIFGIIFTERI